MCHLRPRRREEALGTEAQTGGGLGVGNTSSPGDRTEQRQQVEQEAGGAGGGNGAVQSVPRGWNGKFRFPWVERRPSPHPDSITGSMK